jgi:biotin transport system substrate-specific component
MALSWLEPAPSRTLAERWFPVRSWAVDAGLVAGGAALTALLAQVAIPLPFTPVPVTGQTFAVLTTGAALGARRGVLSQGLYVLLGLAGLPVFAGGHGGLATLLGPNGGYLLGFILAAALLGYLAERGWDRGRRVVLAMILGEVALYAVGVPWLSAYVGGLGRAIVLGFLPFLVGDAVKLALAAGLLPTAWRITERLQAGSSSSRR